jgi:transcription-repair coupling factor (superfamily II helicase)
VDVVTMSATPIPRTLHMSLLGLRDMSVIETPPKDRLAIHTVVAPLRRI